MRYEDENIWLTQEMMATLYDVSVAAINQHIKKIYDDLELEPDATIKKYLTVQTEGVRQVQRETNHYNLRNTWGLLPGQMPQTARLGKTMLQLLKFILLFGMSDFIIPIEVERLLFGRRGHYRNDTLTDEVTLVSRAGYG